MIVAGSLNIDQAIFFSNAVAGEAAQASCCEAFVIRWVNEDNVVALAAVVQPVERIGTLDCDVACAEQAYAFLELLTGGRSLLNQGHTGGAAGDGLKTQHTTAGKKVEAGSALNHRR